MCNLFFSWCIFFVHLASGARPETKKRSKYSQRNNGPKKIPKTYTNFEGVGFLEGKKPFKNKKTIKWKNTEVFLDFVFLLVRKLVNLWEITWYFRKGVNGGCQREIKLLTFFRKYPVFGKNPVFWNENTRKSTKKTWVSFKLIIIQWVTDT